MRIRRPTLVALVLLATGTACVPGYVSYGAWVDTMPPAPMVEITAGAPGPNFAWVNGYWSWTGARYMWIRGYWAPRPVDGYVWVQSGWVPSGGRYRFVPGRWSHPSRRPRVRYVHPRPRVRVQPGALYRTRRPTVGVR